MLPRPCMQYADTRICLSRHVAFVRGRERTLHALTGICECRHIACMAEATWVALTDPKRRAALDLLRQRPRAVGELVDALKLSQPTTSKHLRVLREAGLVTVLPDAQRRIYAIDPAPLAELDAWLAPYRQLWNEHHDELGRHLDKTTKRSRRDGSR